MTTLLHISASPRGQRSESLAIAGTFLDQLRAAHPQVTVEHWDLWDGTLPEFGPPAAAAKMAVFAGSDPEGDEAAAWRAARDTFERFDSADYYLFTVPMWNASVPYILKQFIDVVSQPGMIFGFDPVRATPACWRTSGSQSSTPALSTAPTAALASATTSSSRTSRTGCAGPASTTSAASRSAPTWPPPTRRRDAAPRTPAPPRSPEGSCPPPSRPCWRGD